MVLVCDTVDVKAGITLNVVAFPVFVFLDVHVFAGDEEEEAVSASNAMIELCLIYAESGSAASPPLLMKALATRNQRARHRVWGLQAFRRLLRNIRYFHVIAQVLV